MEAYAWDDLVTSREAGWLKYVVNEDGTTSILVLSEDGESYTDTDYYVTADGKTFYLAGAPFNIRI
jgi:hypothetical protein